MTTSIKEQTANRNLVETLKKSIPFAHGLLITTVPRGDLQVAQPANAPESLLRAYANGLHQDDAITWQAILQDKVLRPTDVWAGDAFERSAYQRDLLQPLGLQFVIVVPLKAPVLDGYPGALHLFRTPEQGDFTRSELDEIDQLVRKLDEGLVTSRGSRRAGCRPRPAGIERPQAHLVILTDDAKPVYPKDATEILDPGLFNQMVDQSRRQHHALNGHPLAADRVQLSDMHGDHWPFRVVTYKRYPALGNGSFTFFCLQPDCCEWGVIKPADFGADPELSRLIPALKFMQQEFRRGPSLQEISGTVNLSPFHFHRRFTELLGLTPKQYMLACQIHDAKVELLAGEKELVQIARECGFAHQSHFTSRFKQATGLTPTRWRRMAQQRGTASEN